MGVTVTTYCKRCRVAAPEVGDFGFIGSPTLGPAKRGDVTPFGTIYAGLAALRLVTPELAGFKAFLDEHGRHPIVQQSDADDEEDGDAPSTPRLKPFRFRATGFVAGFYDLRCGQCDASIRANADAIRPFEPFAPTAAEIALFRRDAPGGDDDALYHVGGFPFDDLDALHTFVSAHGSHGVTAALERSKGAAKTKPSITTTPDLAVAEPWTPPEWKPEHSERDLGPVEAEWLPFLAALVHRDAEVRAAAATELEKRKAAGALGHLAARVLDEDARARVAVVRALGALSDGRALRPLGIALLDENEAVRTAAEEAVARLGSSADDARARARQLQGPYAAPPTVKAAARDRRSIEAALRHPHATVRESAAQALAKKTREPWALELLLIAAVDPSSSVRGEAATALAKRKDERALTALRALLRDGDHAGSQAADAAAKSPSFLASPGAAAALAEALPHVRYPSDVIDALKTLADARVIPRLLEARRDPRVAVRTAVLKVLAGHLDTDGARAAFIEALDDADEAVAELAAETLEPLESAHQDVAAALDRAQARCLRYGSRGGYRARERLNNLPVERRVPGLVALLRDREPSTRASTAEELLALDAPRGKRAIVAAARRGDAAVARTAFRLLLSVGDAATEDALCAMLRDNSFESDFAEMATQALRCGNERLANLARFLLAENEEKPLARVEKVVWGSSAGAAWLRP